MVNDIWYLMGGISFFKNSTVKIPWISRDNSITR